MAWCVRRRRSPAVRSVRYRRYYLSTGLVEVCSRNPVGIPKVVIGGITGFIGSVFVGAGGLDIVEDKRGKDYWRPSHAIIDLDILNI